MATPAFIRGTGRPPDNPISPDDPSGFEKWGKSWDPFGERGGRPRYTKRQLGDSEIHELLRGKHTDVHPLERFLVERFPGPLNRESHAGTVPLPEHLPSRPGGVYFSRSAPDKPIWGVGDKGTIWVGPVGAGPSQWCSVVQAALKARGLHAPPVGNRPCDGPRPLRRRCIAGRSFGAGEASDHPGRPLRRRLGAGHLRDHFYTTSAAAERDNTAAKGGYLNEGVGLPRLIPSR